MSPLTNSASAPQPTPTAPAPLLLTAKQAAAALAISERKLWSLTAGQALPVVRIGRAVRYSPAALQAWIEGQQKGGAQQ
jgi:excisionase family DNA binding protein